MNLYNKYKRYKLYRNGVPVEPVIYRKGAFIESDFYDSIEECEKSQGFIFYAQPFDDNFVLRVNFTLTDNTTLTKYYTLENKNVFLKIDTEVDKLKIKKIQFYNCLLERLRIVSKAPNLLEISFNQIRTDNTVRIENKTTTIESDYIFDNAFIDTSSNRWQNKFYNNSIILKNINSDTSQEMSDGNDIYYSSSFSLFNAPLLKYDNVKSIGYMYNGQHGIRIDCPLLSLKSLEEAAGIIYVWGDYNILGLPSYYDNYINLPSLNLQSLKKCERIVSVDLPFSVDNKLVGQTNLCDIDYVKKCFDIIKTTENIEEVRNICTLYFSAFIGLNVNHNLEYETITINNKWDKLHTVTDSLIQYSNPCANILLRLPNFTGNSIEGSSTSNFIQCNRIEAPNLELKNIQSMNNLLTLNDIDDVILPKLSLSNLERCSNYLLFFNVYSYASTVPENNIIPAKSNINVNLSSFNPKKLDSLQLYHDNTYNFTINNFDCSSFEGTNCSYLSVTDSYKSKIINLNLSSLNPSVDSVLNITNSYNVDLSGLTGQNKITLYIHFLFDERDGYYDLSNLEADKLTIGQAYLGYGSYREEGNTLTIKCKESVKTKLQLNNDSLKTGLLVKRINWQIVD